jgi:glycosyltransferase involved in cell wall biosynthesis
MKCIINASTLTAGGGITVAVNFIKCLQAHALNKGHHFLIIVPSMDVYEDITEYPVEKLRVPTSLGRLHNRLFLEQWLLGNVIEYDPDIIISMGNIAIPVNGVKQVVLLHFAFAVYPNSVVWKHLPFWESMRFKLMGYVVRRRMKLASHVFVQTQAMKDRLISVVDISTDSVSIVPNSVSLDSLSVGVGEVSRLKGYFIESNVFKLLCLSRYYAHKNIESLLAVAECIRDRNGGACIYLTIDENQGDGASKLLAEIKSRELEEVLINIGAVDASEIPFVYNSVDALILPTLIESYSGTYIEAMHFRKLILTSDMDFAHAVCGNSAFYFDPLHTESIFERLLEARTVLSGKGKELAEIYEGYEEILNANPSWGQCTDLIVRKLEELSK